MPTSEWRSAGGQARFSELYLCTPIPPSNLAQSAWESPAELLSYVTGHWEALQFCGGWKVVLAARPYAAHVCPLANSSAAVERVAQAPTALHYAELWRASPFKLWYAPTPTHRWHAPVFHVMSGAGVDAALMKAVKKNAIEADTYVDIIAAAKGDLIVTPTPAMADAVNNMRHSLLVAASSASQPFPTIVTCAETGALLDAATLTGAVDPGLDGPLAVGERVRVCSGIPADLFPVGDVVSMDSSSATVRLLGSHRTVRVARAVTGIRASCGRMAAVSMLPLIRASAVSIDTVHHLLPFGGVPVALVFAPTSSSAPHFLTLHTFVAMVAAGGDIANVKLINGHHSWFGKDGIAKVWTRCSSSHLLRRASATFSRAIVDCLDGAAHVRTDVAGTGGPEPLSCPLVRVALSGAIADRHLFWLTRDQVRSSCELAGSARRVCGTAERGENVLSFTWVDPAAAVPGAAEDLSTLPACSATARVFSP